MQTAFTIDANRRVKPLGVQRLVLSTDLAIRSNACVVEAYILAFTRRPKGLNLAAFILIQGIAGDGGSR